MCAKLFGKEGEKLTLHPSLDAPRTHQILPITTLRTREATGYESVS